MNTHGIADIDQLLYLSLVILIVRKEYAWRSGTHKDKGVGSNHIAGKFRAIAICVMIINECNRITAIAEMNHTGRLIGCAIGFPHQFCHIS